MPLTEICNAAYTDPRQRQLFKNIIYVGALAALLDIDPAAIEKLIGEQFKGKDKLIKPNLHGAAHGPRLRPRTPRADRPAGEAGRQGGRQIFIDGNSAAALGAVYGGATVCAWYPITPSTSLAEAFARYCQRIPHRPRDRQGALRHRPGRGRDSPPSASSSAPAGTARAPSPPPPGPAFR